jgi:hypothetical protein
MTMGDMGDILNDWRKAKQEKRASNREASPRLLREAGIGYAVHNGGAHLVVQGNGQMFDFWPASGLWIQRGTKSKQRGVNALIRFIRATDPPTEAERVENGR